MIERNMRVAVNANYMSGFFMDFPYPAISVFDLKVAAQAYVTAGYFYDYAESVQTGLKMFAQYYVERVTRCPGSIWVLAGYSQGAHLAGDAAQIVDANKLAFVGLVADPKAYLPEGKGGYFSQACKGEDFSDYRVYVPDCKTYKGALQDRVPYEPDRLKGKIGLWCKRNDYICGSSNTVLNTLAHGTYHEDFTYAWLAFIAEQKIREIKPTMPRNYASNTSARLSSAIYVDVKITDLQQNIIGSHAVFAALDMDELYIESGKEFTLDASQSKSLALRQLEYYWKIDDGDFVKGDAVQVFRFDVSGDHEITVRVNDEYAIDECVSYIHVDNIPPSEQELLPAPNVEYEKINDRVILHWNSTPDGAELMLVRINGFDLGMFEASGGYGEIGDIRGDSQEVISLHWLDESYNVGEGVYIKAYDEEILLEGSGEVGNDDISNIVDGIYDLFDDGGVSGIIADDNVVDENVNTYDDIALVITSLIVLIAISLLAIKIPTLR